MLPAVVTSPTRAQAKKRRKNRKEKSPFEKKM
jgi:hypothetical protein